MTALVTGFALVLTALPSTGIRAEEGGSLRKLRTQKKIYECKDAAGNTRFTDTPCAPGEDTTGATQEDPELRKAPAVSPPTARPERTRRGRRRRERGEARKERRGRRRRRRGEPVHAPRSDADKPPPGVLLDQAGVGLAFQEREVTVYNVTQLFAYDKLNSRWKSVGAVGRAESDSLKHAIAEFNKIPGLRLKLRYAEAGGSTFSLNHVRRHMDKIVVYWAEDAKKGDLISPYSWRTDHYIGGARAMARLPNGKYGHAKQKREAGTVLSGGAIFMVEYPKTGHGHFKCKGDGPEYCMMHELGHILGLGHKTPKPSIMHGTCGTSFFPADIAGFKYLYGAK